jgi:hypothetical protein
MGFLDPSIHRVTRIRAAVSKGPGDPYAYCNLTLGFSQEKQPYLNEDQFPTELSIFADPKHFDKFERLAAAINEIFAEDEEEEK